MNETPTIVLASNSPRRELLALGGWSFALDVADIDEDVRPGEQPACRAAGRDRSCSCGYHCRAGQRNLRQAC